MSELTDERIVSALNEIFNTNLSSSDMYKPDNVKNIYLHFMNDFGFCLDNLNQARFNDYFLA